MLTEYYAVRQRKNVLIMATKTGKDAVWDPELKEKLPDLFGDFSNVKVMAHTDLSTKKGAEQIEQLAKRADVVIIDEAHNFRNHGKKGDEIEGEETTRSRWWRMLDICRGKTVFLLTATPINNTFFDLVHQAELFTDVDADDYFSSIGITSLRKYVIELERPFRTGADLDHAEVDAAMSNDKLLQSIIHQNSRKYAVESAKLAGGSEVRFPETADTEGRSVRVRRALPAAVQRAGGSLREEGAALRPADVLPALLLDRRGRRHPPGEPPEAGRRSDSNDLPEALRVEHRGLRGLLPRPLVEDSEVARRQRRSDPDYEARLATWRTDNEPTLQAIHDEYRSTLEEVWHPEELTDEELDELGLQARRRRVRLRRHVRRGFRRPRPAQSVHEADPGRQRYRLEVRVPA